VLVQTLFLRWRFLFSYGSPNRKVPQVIALAEQRAKRGSMVCHEIVMLQN
jgi:hypothetical protein